MTWRPTPLAYSLATLMAWPLFLGILMDRAELFVAAIPLAAALLSPNRSNRVPPRFALRQQISADRLSEGDRVLVTVTVTATDPVPTLKPMLTWPVAADQR